MIIGGEVWGVWEQWWAWGTLAVVLVIAEIMLPGYVLLGFGIGAGIMALLAALLPPGHGWVMESLPRALLVYAVLSLISWLALRRWAGFKSKVVDRDIND